MKIGPNGKPLGRKKGKEWTPGQYAISRVMSNFLALAMGVKKETIQSYFCREKKSLANLQDCRDYLKNNIK